MLELSLRPYQDEALDAVFAWFRSKKGNPLVVVPTGGGKSVIMAALISEIMAQHPNERVLCLTHVKELIAQNHAALLRAWPDAPAGMLSAGLRRRDHDARILFAGVQTIANRMDRIGWVDLLLVDEAHRIPRDGATQYQQVIGTLRAMNSNLRVVGFTATPFRTGEGMLFGPDPDQLFAGVAYTCEIPRLIEEGWLSTLTAKGGGDANIDLSGVAVRMGDYVESQMEEAAMRDNKVEMAVSRVVAKAEGRRGILVFCCGVAHAEKVTDLLNQAGIESKLVVGSTPDDVRDQIVRDFRERKLRCVVNVNVLTTGFDAPHTDLVVLLRATISPVLYVQMVGRGLRVAEGKTDCLVLDFGHNVRRHGPLDLVEIREPKKREGQPDEDTLVAKECPKCSSIVLRSEDTCPHCGYVWPVVEREQAKHEPEPEQERPILAIAKPVFERLRVSGQSMFLNVGRDGKPNTLRVEYRISLTDKVSEWVCFDHPENSFAKLKAGTWWRKSGGRDPIPSSVREALDRSDELNQVSEIVVDRRGEYPRITGAIFGRQSGHEDEPTPEYLQRPALDDLPF